MSSPAKVNVHTVYTYMYPWFSYMIWIIIPCRQTKYPPIYITYQFAKLHVCQMYHIYGMLTSQTKFSRNQACTWFKNLPIHNHARTHNYRSHVITKVNTLMVLKTLTSIIHCAYHRWVLKKPASFSQCRQYRHIKKLLRSL